MEIIIISLVALVASLLTFFSGFGLGTILMPVFAIFFPLEVAIAMTGVVHFSNNMFKIALVGRNCNKEVLLRFGLPAIVAAFAGAWLLMQLSSLPIIASYTLYERTFHISIINLSIGILLLIFAMMEVVPYFKNLTFHKNKMIIGGALSGFFGGLAGIQGALRSAFLMKSGLSKESYVATGVAIACLVDLSRMSIYFSRFQAANLSENITLLLCAILAALAGALLGKKFLKKITIQSIQYLVSVMLAIIALALIAGII